MTSSQHLYEVLPRKDHRGVNLISHALLFGRLWYAEPNVRGAATPKNDRPKRLPHARGLDLCQTARAANNPIFPHR
jgi:hypothetical protein